MNILFLGDSITEGNLGVSYVDMVKEKKQDWITDNRGIGGDTVSSLYRRVKKMNDLATFDQIILFIGVNDVFGKLTLPYKIAKVLRRQKWAKNNMVFKNQYLELMECLYSQNKNIIIIPPLLLGENYTNKWNQEITSLVTIINDISTKYNVTYLDLYNTFKATINSKEISDYLPLIIMEMLKDVKELTSTSLVDKRSKERGLHLTLDGVHINSLGATLISDLIISEIES